MRDKRVAIYARVSSSGQDLASQEPDLRRWIEAHAQGRETIWYTDTFTGSVWNRPGLERLERDLREGQIDTIVVWRLDRLGRTAAEMLTFLDQLDASGVKFISIRDGYDTSTPAGRLMRTILAGFAQYEREVLSERIRAGIAKARASGKRWGGRKPGVRPKLTESRLKSIKVLIRAKTPKAEVARQLGLSRSTVYEAVKLLDDHSTPSDPEKRDPG